MLLETHRAESEPPRPPAVRGEGDGSVRGRRRGRRRGRQVGGGEPQRGPGERADALLQDTSRHDGRRRSVQSEEENWGGQGLRSAHARNLNRFGCRVFILFVIY